MRAGGGGGGDCILQAQTSYMPFLIFHGCMHAGPPQLTIPTGAPTVITASISQAIAMLDCPFLARPSASVTWTKDSQDLLFALKNKYMVFRNGSLLISYVMNNDSGSYTCSIVNLLGEARATYDLLIISELMSYRIAVLWCSRQSVIE